MNFRRLTHRVAAVSFATALGFGGVAAAYAGALPATPQRLAHDALGALGVPDHANGHAKDQAAKKAARKAAKAASASTSASPSANGPDVNGPAKAGLCNAWSASGKPKNENSTAFSNLVLAAGGPERVETFCADVAKDHPSGKPTARPSHSPKAERTAKPSRTPKPERTAEPGSNRHTPSAGQPS